MNIEFVHQRLQQTRDIVGDSRRWALNNHREGSIMIRWDEWSGFTKSIEA